MLDASPVGPVIPVSDLPAAITFYRDTLGLPGEDVPGGYALTCGNGTQIYLLAGTSYAGRADWPLASFRVDDLDAVIDDLTGRGVALETIPDGPQRTDARGIADLDGLRIAWIRDQDSQVISLFEPAG